MEENLQLQVMIFVLIVVGFVVRRSGTVDERGQKGLTVLVTNLILPCNIFKAFLSAELDTALSSGLIVLLISVGIQAFSVAYGRLVFRGQPEAQCKNLRYATICSNAGFLGNPVAEGLYGAEGLMLANIYLIPQRIMMWSSGLAIYTESRNWKQTLRQVLLHPCILACIVGVLFMVLRWQLPDLLMRPISAISSCNTAMSMLVVGMVVARLTNLRDFADPTALLYCLHRLVILPALVYGVCLLLPISAMARGLCVILAAMPAGATTSILADRYDQDPAFASKLVIISTALSIPTTLIWTMILL